MSTVVVGGGVAGLAAAIARAAQGETVTLLEARERLGGRCHTIHPGGVPVELGAEFVHGERVETWRWLRAAALEAVEADGVPLRQDAHGLVPAIDDDGMDEVLDALLRLPGEQSLAEALASAALGPADARARVADYVQGFHAADLARMGVRGLARAERAGARGGEHDFRLVHGYGALVAHLALEAARLGVRLMTATPVRTVRWRRRVVVAETERGTFAAERAVIALPLGVLRSGAVRLEPMPEAWRAGLAAVEPGAAVRVTLRFRDRWWADGLGAARTRPGFLFGDAALAFPVWWTCEPLVRPLLTGWAGGPAAARLAGLAPDALRETALASLAAISGCAPAWLDTRLEGVHTHDWQQDPYARGAYSYLAVGGERDAALLSEVVEETLVMAGEHADAGGNLGTVHGALASGERAGHR